MKNQVLADRLVSSYLHSVLDISKASKGINKIAKRLKQYDFDAIAFRGISGALIAPIIALKLKKSLLLVRKPKKETKDSTHSCYRVEGDKHCQRYIIIDDFICSGRTVRAIIKEVNEFDPLALCIGIVLYRETIEHDERVEVIHPRLHETKIPVADDPEIYRIKIEKK